MIEHIPVIEPVPVIEHMPVIEHIWHSCDEHILVIEHITLAKWALSLDFTEIKVYQSLYTYVRMPTWIYLSPWEKKNWKCFLELNFFFKN